jgi:hypothetical protein
MRRPRDNSASDRDPVYVLRVRSVLLQYSVHTKVDTKSAPIFPACAFLALCRILSLLNA